LTPASQTVKVPPPAQTPSTQETPGTELRRAAQSPATPPQPGARESKKVPRSKGTSEVLVTGESEAGYEVDNTTTEQGQIPAARRSSDSIVPEQVLEDQQVTRLEEALRNVSRIRTDDTFAGTINRINIRGFAQDVFLRDGFRKVNSVCEKLRILSGSKC